MSDVIVEGFLREVVNVFPNLKFLKLRAKWIETLSPLEDLFSLREMYVPSTYPEITLKKEGFRKSYTTPLIKLGDTKPPKTCIIVGVREEDEPLTDVEDLIE